MPLVFMPQILWHSKDNKQCDRVYSLDFQPFLAEPSASSTRTFKLATGGADEFVHIWEVSIHGSAPQYATHTDKSILAPENLVVKPGNSDGGASRALQPFTVRVLARLVGHIGEVNAVRWNPNGIILASGGEDRCIFLWAKAEKGGNGLEGGSHDFEEHYSRFQYYRLSHVVNSISWCPEGRLLAVSTEDGHISLIDTFVEGIGKIRHFEGHASFAQGVAMCPKNILLASMGQDQTLRIWKRRNEKQWKNILVLRSAKDQSDFKESIGLESDDVRYSRCVFMNEELSTFFRRLDWSPDGRFLVTPAGVRHSALFRKEDEPETKMEPSYTLYVFHRKLINRGLPMVTHQSPTGPFVVVKFCSLDLSRIEKEKTKFFNKIFKPKGKGKKGKAGKLNNVKKQTVNNEQLSSQTDEKSIKIEDQGYESGSPSKENEGEHQSAGNVSNGVVKKEKSSEESRQNANACNGMHFKCESPPDSAKDVAIKSEEGTPTIKTEDVAPTTEHRTLSETEMLEKEQSDAFCSQPINEHGDDGAVGGRMGKRESKRPNFYEADVNIYNQLNKPTKSKSSKRDEDKEYDTDAEDEVVIPRLMFAAGTLDGSLCFYDTGENKGPIAVLKNLHYCSITDIAWSPDGLVCATSSSDGYITFVVFQKKEFY